MSDEDAVVEHFITPLKAMLGRPRKDEAEAIDTLRMYVRVLKGYPPQVLTAAADRILSKRDKGGWPLPAECRAICEQQMPRREPVRGADMPAVSPKAAERVCCETAIGRRAAQEGWIGQHHDRDVSGMAAKPSAVVRGK